ncbi:MAG: hypothetical protein JWN36_778 [Microbacteriaceae bacterium]|nr:hypothetical protein [Microbacteriaceae bacterium]
MQHAVLPTLLVVMLGITALTWLPAYQRHLVSSFYRRTPIEIPDQVRPRLVRRLTRTTRWSGIPTAVIVAIGWACHGDADWMDLRLWVAAGISTGLLGLVVSALIPEARGPHTSRVARMRRPTVGDYVPLWSRLIGWTTVMALGAILVTSSAVTGTFPAGSRALALVLLLFAAGQVASAVIVRRPQPAESPLELVWSDALRAQSLMELLYLPIFATYSVYIAIYYETPSTMPGALHVWGGAGVAIGFLGFFAIAVISRSTRYRFLERLWPRGVSWDEEDRIWAEKAAAK